MANESFFEGLDDAEDVPAVAAEAPVAEPEVAAKPEAVAPEAAAKPADKPAEKAPEKPAEAVVVQPEVKIAAPEVKAPEAPDPRKWVPVGAHVDLRNQLKAMQAELEALKNPPKKPEPAAAAPDFIADPKAYVDHSTQRVQDALAQLEGKLQPITQTAEQANTQAAHANFQVALNNAEASFVAHQPDYGAALDHVRQVRFAELSALHPDVSEPEIRAFMNQEEVQLAANILRSGRNPAQVAYSLAKARGYTPKPPPVAAKPELKPAAPERVAELLPKVPEPVKLAPDLTLGTGTGSPIAGSDIDEDPFDTAYKELFGRKRA